MKVLIIPEDPTLDRFILKPVVEQIFTRLGKSPWIEVLSNPRRLAIEEVEVWMLAIHRRDLDLSWSQVRSEIHPKERIAEPFLAEKVFKLDRGAAIAWAMRGLGKHWKGVLRCCPELKKLQQRIEEWLNGR